MMAETGLAAWAGRQPAWTQDALSRIAAASGFELTEEAISEVRERVIHVAGGGQEGGPTCTPFDPACLESPADADAAPVTLASLGPVSNLDRLAENQILRFALSGVTLIYGDNGSGKSGYARLAKRLCRSLTSDPLRSDVFETPQTPRAQVRYQVGQDEPLELAWTEGEAAPSPLRQISVFDSQNARLYVDERNRVSYMPVELAILEQHGTLCGSLGAAFDREAKDLDRRLKTPPPAGYGEGEIGKLVRGLETSSPTLPDAATFTAHAEWTPALDAEAQELTRQLASDPAVQATVRRRAVSVLRRLGELLPAIEDGLSDEAEAGLRQALSRLRSAEAALALSASHQFAEEPVPGVGSEAWRHLFEAARRFVLQDGADGVGLPAEDDALCALCQEPLGPEGAARLGRFNAFMAADVSRAAESARSALSAARTVMADISIPAADLIREQLAAYGGLSEKRGQALDRILSAFGLWSARRAALGDLSDPQEKTIPAAMASLLPSLETDIVALGEEADALDRTAAHSAQLDQARARLSHLKDVQKLGQDLPTILQRLADLQQLAHLKACAAQVGTGAVSRQLTALRKLLLTNTLQKRVAAEVAQLDLGHLPFEMIDSSASGQSLVGVGLRGVKKVKNSQILSEGEQRALALACFLAEVADGGAGIIVDDPVSSLDHQRVRRVAHRLVKEAARGRQVIVFTHNLVFFNEMISEAARLQTPLHKAIIRHAAAEGHGVVMENAEPWVVRDVNARITELRARAIALGEAWDTEPDQQRRHAKDFYSDLRETWERTVEEVVFCKTVQRLDPSVMTLRLRGVRVENPDYQTIYFAMKRASERSGHDMAAARDLPIPTPHDMKEDVEVLNTFVTDYRKRTKTLNAERLELETPAPGRLG